MRQKRMQYNLTQSDLAIVFKVYKSTIDKWERGVANPNTFNRNQIIEFLGYNPIHSIQVN